LVEARVFSVVDEALCGVVVATGGAYPEREQLAVSHQFLAVEPWATNQPLKVAFQVGIPRVEEFDRYSVAYCEMLDCCACCHAVSLRTG
jgi:hypothetical protein